MPSPTETLFRVQDSPVPTQTVFGACGSIAMAPIDCTGCLSKTGLYVLPPFTDFQTPPLAAPTYTVSRPSSLTAVTAAMRPLIAAEPIFREPKPEMVSESNTASCAPILAGKGKIKSIHLLVVAEECLGVLHCSADVTFVFDFEFQERIAIQEVVTDIAIFQGELHLVTICALNRIMSGEFGLVPLLQIVHQRTIDVRIYQQSLSVVLLHSFRVLAAGEGRNLPSNFAVVSLYLC